MCVCIYMSISIPLDFQKKTRPFCSLFEDRICCVFLCSSSGRLAPHPQVCEVFIGPESYASRSFYQKKTTVFPFTSKKLQLVSWWFFTNPFEKYATIKNGFMNLPPIIQGENSTKIFEALIHHLDNLEKPDQTRHCHRWRGVFCFSFCPAFYRHPYMCMPGCIGIGGLVIVSFLSSHQMRSWVNSKEILTGVYKKLVGGFNLGEK